MRVDEAVAPALETGQIAYTYSEPLIHLEFLKDCMECAHEQGLANVLVSNGCIETAALETILPLIDAANIDLKCFSETTYREVLGGSLETVLDGIRAIYRRGICLELTTLVVPGLNDSEAELDRCAAFIAALGAEPVEYAEPAGPAGPPTAAGCAGPSTAPRKPDAGLPAGRPVPWHLSAYHPSYRWDAPPTGRAALLRLAARARKTLPYVYTGNIAGEENDTPCPRCGAVLIRRRAYQVDTGLLVPPSPEGEPGTVTRPRPYRCAACGAAVPVYR
jgi:pyruvate formate lyase activating enzyme